jgi:hypothetical protein
MVKHDFKQDPFPVEALPMFCGAAAGDQWLCDMLLVELGLCTMHCAAN